MFGANAESIQARRPRHIFMDPQRVLGHNGTHPDVLDYTQRSAVETLVNARGGLSFVVPKEESGLAYLHSTATPTASATDSGSASAAASVSSTPTPVADAAGALLPSGGLAFSTEEIVSMVLAHVKEFSQVFAGGPIQDAVITVPSYWTQNERIALMDAADLAGLNVLSLVDENTAGGIHYGIDRVFENTTHHMILYNMGYSATQVTLFAYDSYTVPEKGTTTTKNRTVGQGRVVAKAWDIGIGGRTFDRVLIDYVAAKFNKEKGKLLPAAAAGDIRNLGLSMAKIRKNIVKAKEVLSANEEFQATFESVLPDVDFKCPLTRKLLEAEAEKAGVYARLVVPIDAVLAQAGITFADVDVMEVVGGGVRVPSVQAALRKHLEGKGVAGADVPFGLHLNGDEAMTLGAAFLAANRSSSFRVRKVGMVDTNPWPIGVRLTALSASAASTSTPASHTDGSSAQETGEDAAGSSSGAAGAGKAWSKRSSLFKPYNHLESVKRITFPCDKDLRANLFYEATAAASSEGAAATNMPLPEGTSRVLAFYNITGIEKLAADLANGTNPSATTAAAAAAVPLNITGPLKVTLSFELDHNGLTRLLRAEATVDEDYWATATPTPFVLPSFTSSPSSSSSTSDAAASSSETSSPTSSDSPSASASSSVSGSTSGSSSSANADSSTSSTASISATPAPKVLMKRTLRFPLQVDVDTTPLAVQPMGAGDKAAALVTLKKLNKADEEKR